MPHYTISILVIQLPILILQIILFCPCFVSFLNTEEAASTEVPSNGMDEKPPGPADSNEPEDNTERSVEESGSGDGGSNCEGDTKMDE